MASANFWKTWVRPEVYPLFFAIGGGCGLCVFMCSRTLMHNPDVRVMKPDRTAGVLEEDRFYKEGEFFHNHAIRRFLGSGDVSKEIFASINSKLGGGNH